MSEPRITVDPSRLVVADLDAKEQGVLDRLWKQLRDRLERNRERGIRYEMKNVIAKIANVVPPQYYHAYGALGWNTKAVDALVRRCNFENVSWTGDLGSAGGPDLLGEADTSPPDALEPLGYDDFRDENRLRASIRSASRRAASLRSSSARPRTSPGRHDDDTPAQAPQAPAPAQPPVQEGA